MTSGHVYIATSLDGFIARRDHRIDWLMKQGIEGEDHGYEAFMDSVDGLVMGRGSFLNVLSFGDWPYRKPVVVMSRSLGESDIPEALRDKVRLSTQTPHELMASLQKAGWQRAYIDGGQLVQSFIRKGLIDDIILTTIPILIGDGIRLFGAVEQDIDLHLLSSTSFPSGLVQSHYKLHEQSHDSR